MFLGIRDSRLIQTVGITSGTVGFGLVLCWAVDRRPTNLNAFVEGVLPANIVRKLAVDEMAVYRAPFPTPESRRPTWRFPNELPIAGKPADVSSTIQEAHLALAQSSYPKLLLAADRGALVSPAFAERFASGLKNCSVIHLGPGHHYVQEDHPNAIGSAVHNWLTELEVAGIHFSEIATPPRGLLSANAMRKAD
jgi:pimeloyl-ACP methyl ester carboxylesterase